MIIKGSSSEKRKCGTIDDAVEYINRRPHENFVVYDATKDQIEKIKKKVKNIIEAGN